jgi:hypothetical protein
MLTGLQRSASRARPAARPRRRGGGRLRALHLLCLLLGLLLPTSARADTWGQYLVIIDDSGSMDQNDPRRLVVMAAAAIAGGLEESDQIALIGLNELAAGDTPRFVAPSELLPGRDGPEASLALTSDRLTRLTVHRGNTPCSAALERARAFLDANASAGAPQTLLLLTDGACNGGAVLPRRALARRPTRPPGGALSLRPAHPRRPRAPRRRARPLRRAHRLERRQPDQLRRSQPPPRLRRGHLLQPRPAPRRRRPTWPRAHLRRGPPRPRARDRRSRRRSDRPRPPTSRRRRPRSSDLRHFAAPTTAGA